MNDPQTPEDYLRILSHLIKILEDEWDTLPNVYGDQHSSRELTKSAIFRWIQGCASEGRASIKKQNKIKQMVDSL